MGQKNYSRNTLNQAPMLSHSDGSGFKKNTQSYKAYITLRRLILQCNLYPGSVVNEKDLVTKLGLGRTPIREALLRLAAERLITFKEKIIQIAPISVEYVRDLYEVRLDAERLAIRLAITNMRAQEQQSLLSSFDGADELVVGNKIYELIDLDFNFHSRIYLASGNVFLIEHLHRLFGHSYRLWYTLNDGNVRTLKSVIDSHEPILDSIRIRDVEDADRKITNHIVAAYKNAIDILNKRELTAVTDKTPTSLEEALEGAYDGPALRGGFTQDNPEGPVG